MATATSVSSLRATSVASLPSSVNAFRTAGAPVQHVSVTSMRSNSRSGRLVVARASSEEPQKFAIRREIVAGILAAGVVFSSTGAVLADPLADAKSKVEDALSGAQGSAGKTADDVKSKVDGASLPSAPDVSGATSEAKGKIDGIFGKGKPPPFNFDALGIGSDAKEAVASKVEEAKKTIAQ